MTTTSRGIGTSAVPHWRWSFLFLLLVIVDLDAPAQTVVATIPLTLDPIAVATNSATDKTYVAAGVSWTLVGMVAIIDGKTNSTTTVPVGIRPVAVAVNSVTNKIYVANVGCAGPFGCGNPGGVTVIDGATNSTATVIDANANGPRALAVNSITNKIYVANFWSGNVTVIDGSTNSFVTVADPNAKGIQSVAVAVNPVTNKIYVANNNLFGFSNTTAGNVTVIDGATNSITTVTDPNAIAPVAVAVNPVTNKIYVANEGGYPGPNHGNITVIDGATNSTATVTDSNALAPISVGVNSATNKIYVANLNDAALSGNGGVTVIDGATGAVATVRDPSAVAPTAVAVDSASNVIYVANYGLNPPDSGVNSPGSITVIDGVTNSLATVVDPNAINPVAITVDPATAKVYVANVYSDNVTVIDGSSTAKTYTLLVTPAGSGSGTVTSNPTGITCGTSCSAIFSAGTTVELSASSSSDSFSGWGGACSGTGACSVTMNDDAFVTATFSKAPADFSLSTASESLKVQFGGQVTDAVTLAPQNGSFESDIQLTCAVTGSIPLPTCNLNPTSVTLGSNSATTTLTFTAPTSAMLATAGHQITTLFYALWLPLSVLGIAVSTGHQARRRFRILSLLLFALLAGCGGNNRVIKPPANYTVTVTAMSEAIQHTTQVTVTVQ